MEITIKDDYLVTSLISMSYKFNFNIEKFEEYLNLNEIILYNKEDLLYQIDCYVKEDEEYFNLVNSKLQKKINNINYWEEDNNKISISNFNELFEKLKYLIKN